MKKAFLSKIKRYTLLFFLTCFLIFMGQALFRAYEMTSEKHLMAGLELIATDGPQALAHLKLASHSQNETTKTLANLSLARLYHHGSKGVLKNIPKAVSYYEKVAQLPEAQYLLALFYDAGDQVPENKERAIDYMLKAAKTYAPAQYALAVWMERGYLGKVNMNQIVALYTKAAEQGIPNAIKSLISIYHGGYSGFPRNLELEHYWRTQLAEGNQR